MRRSLSLLLLALSLASCGDGETDTFIRTTVNGQPWAAPAGDAQLTFTAEEPDGAGMFTSIAARDRGSLTDLISIGLPNPIAEGGYAMDGQLTQGAFGTCQSHELLHCSFWSSVGTDPGTLTITSIDEEADLVRGHFTFVGHTSGSEEIPRTFTGDFVIRVPGLGAPVESVSTP